MKHFLRLCLIVGLLLGGLPAGIFAQEDSEDSTTPSLIWTFESPNPIWHLDSWGDGLATGDLTGDGIADVVFGTEAGHVIAVSGKDGSQLWSYSIGSRTGQPVTADIVDIDDDSLLDVMAAGVGSGAVIAALDADGTVKWQSTGDNEEVTDFAYGDMDGDGDTDVAAAVGTYTSRGQVILFDGATGDRLWSCSVGGHTQGMGAADVDGDGDMEIAVDSYNERISLIDGATGTVLWTGGKAWYGRDAIIADVNDDDSYEIVSGGGGVIAYNPDGTQVWASNAEYEAMQMQALDVTGDGKTNVVFSSGFSGTLHVLDGQTGEQLWTRSGAGRHAVGDVDGDGIDDIVAATIRFWGLDPPYSVFAVDGSNNELWRYPLENVRNDLGFNLATANLDGDAALEVLVANGSHLLALDGSYSTPTPPPSPSPTPTTSPTPSPTPSVTPVSSIIAPTDIEGTFDEDDFVAGIDIRGVEIADLGSEYEITLHLDGAPFETTNSAYGVLIDADRDSETGYRLYNLGADYAISVYGIEDLPGAMRYQAVWDSAKNGWAAQGYPDERYRTGDDSVTFTVGKFEIGNVDHFNMLGCGTYAPWPIAYQSMPMDIMPDFGGYFEVRDGGLIPHVSFTSRWMADEVGPAHGEEFVWFTPVLPYGKYIGLSQVKVDLYDAALDHVATVLDTSASPPAICDRSIYGPRDPSRSETTACTADFFATSGGRYPGFLFDTTKYADGKYELRATFVDELGQTMVEILPITIDNQNDPPDVTILKPHDGGVIGQTTFFRFYAIDDDLKNASEYRYGMPTTGSRELDEISELSLTIEAGGVTTIKPGASDLTDCGVCYVEPGRAAHSCKEYTFDATEYDGQTLTIEVRAEDSAGNVSTQTATVTVDLCPGQPSADYCTDNDGDGINTYYDCDDDDADNTTRKFDTAGNRVDRDGDGVYDCDDICPDKAGSADYEGCADQDSAATNWLGRACEIFDPLQWCPPASEVPDPDFSTRVLCELVGVLTCEIEVLSEYIWWLEVIDLAEDGLCDVLPHGISAIEAYQQGNDRLFKEELGLTLKNSVRVLWDAFSDKVLGKVNLYKQYKMVFTIVECLDKASSLSDEIVRAVAPAFFDLIGGVVAFVWSPVDIHVYDSQGRHVGPGEDGKPEIGIPDAFYGELGDHKVVALPDAGADYTIDLNAYQDGDFDLDIRTIAEGSIQSVSYDDVQVSDHSRAQVTAGTGATLTMNVDEDGDGTYETTRVPDAVFIDSDADGIADDQDLCPDTPVGCTVGMDGCTQDADGDGVCDTLDTCRGYDDAADEDGDGIPDGCEETGAPVPADDGSAAISEDGGGMSGTVFIIIAIAGAAVLAAIAIMVRRRGKPQPASVSPPGPSTPPAIPPEPPPSEPPAPSMLTCADCGAPNMRGASFCKMCGSKLDS